MVSIQHSSLLTNIGKCEVNSSSNVESFFSLENKYVSMYTVILSQFFEKRTESKSVIFGSIMVLKCINPVIGSCPYENCEKGRSRHHWEVLYETDVRLPYQQENLRRNRNHSFETVEEQNCRVSVILYRSIDANHRIICVFRSGFAASSHIWWRDYDTVRYEVFRSSYKKRNEKEGITTCPRYPLWSKM